MPQSKPVLIIAQSGRALAESAVKAGINAHVIDRFADQDTRKAAASTQVIGGTGSGFNTEQLLAALAEFNNLPLMGVITGSGFEADIVMLDRVGQHTPLIGNSVDTVKRCKIPQLFFPMLDELQIPYPDTRFNISDTGPGWLLKQIGGSGGEHISPLVNCVMTPENHYVQKKIEGQNLSVVFLADGNRSIIIGINETWTVDSGQSDYRYAGAITLPEVDKNFYTLLDGYITSLTKELHLKGLCGIDFIVDQTGKCNVLEVNPRPVASFELHENDCSLLQAHIMACTGKLIPGYKKMNSYKAHGIIYTQTDLAIPEVDWPVWVSDRPVSSKTISSGMPVCTIHAEGKNLDAAKTLLNTRTNIMQNLIKQFQLAA